ncbi:hypothetical protein DKX38_016537 [Salix brachista]|uniref:SGNH hydrolase-type esterase domain-containing protein n=1 Tax=Salix brachista TaxID=2182728 RepID=A0A5N5L8A2_9ROSI|nr:hypothetical protein DKX38_016537 [Salix brachista]
MPIKLDHVFLKTSPTSQISLSFSFSMETKGKLFALLLLLSLVAVSTGHGEKQNARLFVIGDSFVDTGNMGNRTSDGLMLTDYIASFLHRRTPVIYAQRKKASKSELEDGMNFARGGSGVLDVSFNNYSMTLQVGNFKEQIAQNVYTKVDLENSIALVSYTGNDYLYKTTRQKGTMKDVFDQTKTIVDLLTKNLREIRGLGVKKIAIFGTPPRGCFPGMYSETLRKCDRTWNKASRQHNKLLKESLKILNKERHGSKFVYLDLYNAIDSALFDKIKEIVGFANRFKACCLDAHMCGPIAQKKCKNPELSIFWDAGHLSQNGANIVYTYLVPSLSQLL